RIKTTAVLSPSWLGIKTHPTYSSSRDPLSGQIQPLALPKVRYFQSKRQDPRTKHIRPTFPAPSPEQCPYSPTREGRGHCRGIDHRREIGLDYRVTCIPDILLPADVS